MGTYLNPGNGGFARIANNEYVDKTGMIGLLNKAIGTTKNLTCISRPRRFAKILCGADAVRLLRCDLRFTRAV